MSAETQISDEAFKEVIYYLKFGIKKDFEDAVRPITKSLSEICSEISDFKLIVDMHLEAERWLDN